MLYIDMKYSDRISPVLEGFKLKSSTPYRANCRCPLCGDSQKNKHKKRGWILQSKEGDGLVYFCHNCNESMPFSKFLERVDHHAYSSYEFERKREFFESMGGKKVKEPEPEQRTAPVFKVANTKQYLTRISALSVSHPVRRYVVETRKVPSNQHYRIFFCKEFPLWINSIIPNKLKVDNDPRLVMPVCDENKKIIGVTARALLKDKEPRYINIMFDESQPKIYGRDVVDTSRKYYVVEGAFDSFFLPNCMALNGSSFDPEHFKNPENAVIVLDNQNRDKGVLRTMEKVIDAGLSVVVWPATMDMKDDINMMVQRGLDPLSIIKEHTYKGLSARLAFNKWRKLEI